MPNPPTRSKGVKERKYGGGSIRDPTEPLLPDEHEKSRGKSALASLGIKKKYRKNAKR